MNRALVMLVVAMSVVGCAHSQAASSNPGAKDVSVDDASVLAPEVVSILKAEAPPGPTVALVVDKGAGPNTLATVVAPRLVAAGYAVAEAGQPVRDGALHVRYMAVPMVGGVLLRLEVGQVLASRWFARSAGGAGPLKAASPVAIGRWP